MPNKKQVPQEPLTLDVRWMVRRDMKEVLAIDWASFTDDWQEEDFLRCLRQRNCIGMVVEQKYSEPIFGFMIYELEKHSLNLLRFAVHQKFRRRGVGAGMVGKLKSKLLSHRRRSITCEVPEEMLAAQLFLRSQGFKASAVVNGAYAMRFDIDGVTDRPEQERLEDEEFAAIEAWEKS